MDLFLAVVEKKLFSLDIEVIRGLSKNGMMGCVIFNMLFVGALPAQAVSFDGGSLLQQIEQDKLRARIQPQPRVVIQQSAMPESEDAEVRFVLRSFELRNISRFSQEELGALLADVTGREIALSELKQHIARITDYYHKHGYPAAYAYLPPQEIGADGRVEVHVIEGYLGEIHVRNESRLHEGVAERRLPATKTGDILESVPIERSAILLSELPGTSAQLSFNPGKDAGFTDIDILLVDKPIIGGALTVDNQGNRYTGDGWRKNLRAELRNPSTWGDFLQFNWLDGGSGMTYWQAGYQIPAMLAGTAKVGLDYSEVNYRLGGSFAAAGMQGSTRSVSAYWVYPVIRQEASNLTVEFRSQQKELLDQIVSAGDNRGRRISNIQVSFSGNWRDTGYNGWSLGWGAGELVFRDAVHRFLDFMSADTAGVFNKLTWAFTRMGMMPLSETISYQINANGQTASKNMDSAEKMVLGGAHGVRAYPASEGMGDDGVLLSGELKRSMTEIDPGLQLSAFVDYGYVKYNHRPWPAVMGNNNVTLGGMGVGIRYDYGKWLSLSAQSAWRTTRQMPQSGPDRLGGRVWFELNLSLM